MKKIESIIQPEELGEVNDAVAKLGVVGLYATYVKGRGRWGYHRRIGQMVNNRYST